MIRIVRLKRFIKGDKRYYAPKCPILLTGRFMVKFERLRRFAKGVNRDYAPMCPISL